MSKMSRRYFLRRKERKPFSDKVSGKLGINLNKIFGSRPQIEVIETPQNRVYMVDGHPVIAESDDELFPTLLFKEYILALPKAVVDMGAVPYVCNGADVMAPGVVEIQGQFEKESLIVILDEKNRKPLAIVKAVFDSETSRQTRKGNLFRNLHFVGDEIWNTAKES
jgi:PUA-domain protein